MRCPNCGVILLKDGHVCTVPTTWGKVDGQYVEQGREIIDYIFSEVEDYAWQGAEPNFTKRIATPLPTKRRRRVTL